RDLRCARGGRATATGLRTSLIAARAGPWPIPGGSPPLPPKVSQLVVFRDSSFKEKAARAKRIAVHLGRRRCVVGAGTPLAALLASKVAKIGLRDYGSCSSRARDAAGLFVR